MCDAASETVHATAVELAGRGLLICGRAGAGKSSLALQLMAMGATLVADDRTELHLRGARIILRAPDAIRGLIEARGLGLLNAACTDAPLCAVLDLDREESERLPPTRMRNVLGLDFPLLHKIACPYFAASLRQYLMAGRRE
ncbi:HPr kinase/phosphorylase [Sagittula salina]|uniref:HPr kinase/phosphatase C-terminal domain-containing protein n=1 Tax=Sagittula salina TaxID=2820268 RepID=A0A940MKE1_9RHOB|nr:HPr kinase/phosphatase C-terminal domain-containing protein [Sagittula salina]MBP0483430.1 HPr kinase/phosphatase C-terminal domain-containing protein [Sagittula salina]